jgi:hypothetical protein
MCGAYIVHVTCTEATAAILSLVPVALQRSVNDGVRSIPQYAVSSYWPPVNRLTGRQAPAQLTGSTVGRFALAEGGALADPVNAPSAPGTRSCSARGGPPPLTRASSGDHASVAITCRHHWSASPSLYAFQALQPLHALQALLVRHRLAKIRVCCRRGRASALCAHTAGGRHSARSPLPMTITCPRMPTPVVDAGAGTMTTAAGGGITPFC